MSGCIQVKMVWELVINELDVSYSLHDAEKFNNICKCRAICKIYTYIIILFFSFLCKKQWSYVALC